MYYIECSKCRTMFFGASGADTVCTGCVKKPAPAEEISEETRKKVHDQVAKWIRTAKES